MSRRDFPVFTGDLACWVAEMDTLAATLARPGVEVRARVLDDGRGVLRPYWTVERGRFAARLPLLDCPCREGEGRLSPCPVLGELPQNHYGVSHCHAWHPEKVKLYVAAIDRMPKLTPKPLPRIRYREVDYVAA